MRDVVSNPPDQIFLLFRVTQELGLGLVLRLVLGLGIYTVRGCVEEVWRCLVLSCRVRGLPCKRRR